MAIYCTTWLHKPLVEVAQSKHEVSKGRKYSVSIKSYGLNFGWGWYYTQRHYCSNIGSRDIMIKCHLCQMYNHSRSSLSEQWTKPVFASIGRVFSSHRFTKQLGPTKITAIYTNIGVLNDRRRHQPFACHLPAVEWIECARNLLTTC